MYSKAIWLGGFSRKNFDFCPVAPTDNIAVIGGGYIAVELGSLLQALGSQVTLVALEDRLLERFDGMISEVMARSLRSE